MSGVWLRRTDYLLGKTVIGGIAMAWGVLLGFDVIVAVATEMGDVGRGDYGALDLLIHVFLTVPRRAYVLFPTSAVIGCLLGLGTLAASSELTALRAAGISRLRICMGALMAVGGLLLLVMLSAETIAPRGDQAAQALRVSATSKDIGLARWSGLWAREGDTFLNARVGRIKQGEAGPYVELDRVRLYEFDPNGRLVSLAQAARAEHRDMRWTLFDLRRTEFLERGVTTKLIEREAWDSQLSPDVLSLSVRTPRYLSSADLLGNLEYLQRNGLDTTEFESALWSRWLYPLNVLALCLLAMPFAFGSLRSGGFGKRLFIGIMFGLGFFVVQRLAVSMAEVYRLDLRLAHGLPAAVMMLVSWLWWRRQAA